MVLAFDSSTQKAKAGWFLWLEASQSYRVRPLVKETKTGQAVPHPTTCRMWWLKILMQAVRR